MSVRNSEHIINKPVGFYSPIAPPFRNAPQALIAARHRFKQNILPSVVLLQQCHCRNSHRGKLQNLPPLSILFESSQIFLQYTGDTDATNDGPEFWNYNSVIFENFFEIFKKALRGPFAADLDHYGRSQTGSE